MSGKPNVLRPITLHTSLPEDLHGRLSAYLFSPSENRVPKGAYQRFIIDRIIEFFNRKDQPNEPHS